MAASERSNFTSKFGDLFRRLRNSRKVCRSDTIELSDISKRTSVRFTIEEDKVGVVYIVENDYHSQMNAALRNHGKDSKNMEKLFSYDIEDNYCVVSGRNVTSTEFLSVCRNLANFEDYPKDCDKIIIYFSGHGKDNYIIMERDYSTIKNSTTRSNPEEEIYEDTLVKIDKILALFRDQPSTKKRILLLDACCCADSEYVCEENELVACAGSDKFGAMSTAETGGYWTKEFCYQLNEGKHCDILNLLESVQEKMNSTLYWYLVDGKKKTTNLFPTLNNKLQEKISFKKKSMCSVYKLIYMFCPICVYWAIRVWTDVRIWGRTYVFKL